jgi:hypothetical protein
MGHKIDENTKEYIHQAQQTWSETIAGADLALLPEPEQHYLRYA